jgi:hypothetical protein
MKKLILFFIACTLFSTFTYAQKDKAATATKQSKVQGPDMTFESTTVDFGTIQQGSDPFRVAKFVNNGTEPLLVKSATASCGCTVPNWPKEPIMPGESGEIKIRYDTNRVGAINKTVTVNTNIEGKNIILAVKGKILPKEAEQSAPAGTKNIIK